MDNFISFLKSLTWWMLDTDFYFICWLLMSVSLVNIYNFLIHFCSNVCVLYKFSVCISAFTFSSQRLQTLRMALWCFSIRKITLRTKYSVCNNVWLYLDALCTDFHLFPFKFALVFVLSVFYVLLLRKVTLKSTCFEQEGNILEPWNVLSILYIHPKVQHAWHIII